MTYRPRQRTRNLASERIDRELVLSDTTTQNAHALNADHAAVWGACDGTRTIEQISDELHLSRAQVDATVVELLDLELLEPDTAIDRRALLTGTARIGTAAAVLAPIITIALPAAAAMASTVHSGPYLFDSANYELPAGGAVYNITPRSGTEVYIDVSGHGSTSGSGATAPTTLAYIAFGSNPGGDLIATFMLPNGLSGSASYTPDGGAATPLAAGVAADLGNTSAANGTYTIDQT